MQRNDETRRETMKTAGSIPVPVLMILSGLLLMSCMLPGMIPLNREPAGPMPTIEKDPDALIQALRAGEFVYLQALAEEQYTEEDFAKPGTLTFTVTIKDDKPTYFNYGWCTTTEEILKQNFDHIQIKLYFEGKELGSDVVHPVTFTRPDGFVCLDFGVLMSDWSNGEYQLEAVATFDEKINDGAADFEAGDYIYEYNVTVNK
jgi:hypothetical protein